MSATAHELARIHRMTVDDYHRMGEAGILGPELHTELIEGEIVEMPPIGHLHGGTVKFLVNRLTQAVGERVVVSVQDPIRLDNHSEPQPDIALLRPKADFYRTAHPRPGDILLVIEVADTTLRYDRDVKLPLYAKVGIPEAWLVDLQGRRLTVYRNPGADAYGEILPVEDLSRVALPAPLDGAVDLSALF